MALTRTLAQLADGIQRCADVVAFTDKHPLTEIYDLANRGLGALHRITSIVNPEFRPIASTTVTADGDNTEYALPSDCRSIISVEYTNNDGRTVWLTPYSLEERAALVDELSVSATTGASFYRQLGTNIDLQPLPIEDDEAVIWYATTAPQLSAGSPGATVDVFDRLDDYIIWWGARELACERGDWERHDRLDAKLKALEGDIQVIARQRDVSGPLRIVDLAARDRFGRVRWR